MTTGDATLLDDDNIIGVADNNLNLVQPIEGSLDDIEVNKTVALQFPVFAECVWEVCFTICSG